MTLNWTWLGAATAVVFVLACVAGFCRGFVREIVSTFFVILTLLLVWLVNPYVNTFIRENTPVYEKIQESCRNLVQDQAGSGTALNQEEQAELVEEIGLPDLLKDTIMENNTAEAYRYLAVNTFADYVADALAVMAVNGLSFLISFLAITILVRAVTYALDILAKLPIVNGVNKITGAIVGGAKCILFIWIALLAITLLCGTQFGRDMMELIKEDSILSFLYNYDPFIKWFMSIFYGS